jgi:hypothetical protein
MMRNTLCVAACITFALAAAAGPPSVESVAPAVGQRGTEFTLTMSGSRLTGAEELLLYDAGVVCTRLAAQSASTATATLRAAADCRLGEHAFRLRTRGGASEVRTFHITSFPIIAEKEPNDSPKNAQPVPLNVTIAGAIESGGIDSFAVTLKKGQRLAAEVEAVRLGGELTDAVLTVLGPNGREILTVDDTPLFHQDPFVALIAPADGTYIVQVRETNYGGGDSDRYILHVGSFPRPSMIFPTGGQAGTEVNVRLLGDAAGERVQTVKLPAAGEEFAFFPSAGAVAAPTPNPFRVSPFPNVLEAEPNDEPRQATPSPHGWPVAFNGIIDRPGDVDHFRFRAARGDVIDVQAFAFRVGSPVDTVVTVTDSAGATLAANDDDETHDSRVRVHVPADGDYVVRITDKKRSGGPLFHYRIELARPSVGLTVFLAEPVRKSQDRQAISIPRGNRVRAHLGVRRDGFNGPITLALGELPAGVKATVGTILPGEYLMPVVFEADKDAPLGGRLIEVTGKSNGSQPIVGGFRQHVNLTHGPGDSTFHAVTLSRLAVVVTEKSPLAVAVVPPAAPFPVDGTLDLTIKVTRANDFAEAVEVSFPWLPPGVEAPTSVVISPEKTATVATLVAHPWAEIGDWHLAVEAKPAGATRGRRDPLAGGAGNTLMYRRQRRTAEGVIPVSSELLLVKVAAPRLHGRFAPAVAEQGTEIVVACEVNHSLTLAGPFTAKLDGLPPRATAAPVQVKADTRRIEFHVAVAATTPPGEHASLVCELAGTVGGQPIVYRVGRGGVLVVNAPGTVKKDALGQALSPLDALRQSERKTESKKP